MGFLLAFNYETVPHPLPQLNKTWASCTFEGLSKFSFQTIFCVKLCKKSFSSIQDHFSEGFKVGVTTCNPFGRTYGSFWSALSDRASPRINSRVVGYFNFLLHKSVYITLPVVIIRAHRRRRHNKLILAKPSRKENTWRGYNAALFETSRSSFFFWDVNIGELPVKLQRRRVHDTRNGETGRTIIWKNYSQVPELKALIRT